MTNETTYGWHALIASNRQIRYGYGSNHEAERWADHLNRDHDTDLYAVYICTATEVARLDDSDEGVDLCSELAAIALEAQP